MRRVGLVVVLAAAAAAAVVPRAEAAPARASVVGGTPIAIEAAPYQVFLRIGTSAGCGGSVLDARTVLTAAHCVTEPGSTTPRPVSTLTVVAGVTNVTASGGQTAGVASMRVHPLYDEPSKTDDVAVLTLARALDLSGPRVKPIALAPVGAGPAPGAALAFSGYGTQADGQVPDGRLYAATLTAIADDQCRANLAVNASATVQCVAPGTQAACFGDSGGPLTSGGVQVGVASYAPAPGCGRGPTGFADVTAPEVRAFIDGAASVPVAPRLGDQAGLYVVNPPVQGSPFSCATGTWTGAPAFTFTFVDDRTGQALQSGPQPTFVPRAAHRGATVACVIGAANPGGTTTARSGTAPPVQADLVRPRAALYSVRCRKRRCTVRFGAADPNSQGALRIRVTAGRKRFAVRHVGGTTYRAKSKRLRRGRVTVRVRVRDAAGNRARRDLKRRVRVR